MREPNRPGAGPELQRDLLADDEPQLADATAFFAERGIDAEPVAVSGDRPPRSCPWRNGVSRSRGRRDSRGGTGRTGRASSREPADRQDGALRPAHRPSAPLTSHAPAVPCPVARRLRPVADDAALLLERPQRPFHGDGLEAPDAAGVGVVEKRISRIVATMTAAPDRRPSVLQRLARRPRVR